MSVTLNTSALILLPYLSEVPVDAHPFLHGLFAVVEARLAFFLAGISQAAVVVVLVRLDAADVELTTRTIVSELQVVKSARKEQMFDYYLGYFRCVP